MKVRVVWNCRWQRITGPCPRCSFTPVAKCMEANSAAKWRIPWCQTLGSRTAEHCRYTVRIPNFQRTPLWQIASGTAIAHECASFRYYHQRKCVNAKLQSIYNVNFLRKVYSLHFTTTQNDIPIYAQVQGVPTSSLRKKISNTHEDKVGIFFVKIIEAKYVGSDVSLNCPFVSPLLLQ